MSFDFPNAPTNGQTVTAPTGVVYGWDGTKWASVAVALPPYAPLASPTFSGDPQAPTPASGDHDTSLATTAFVQAAVAPAMDNVGRNLLHNPLFNVQQRGAGPFVPAVPGLAYTADRWFVSSILAGDANSVTVPIAVDANRAQVGDEAMQVMLADTFTGGAGAGNACILTQAIERVRRLSGKTVAVSFWAIASAALKLGVSLDQNFGTGGSPSAQVTGTGQSVTLSGTTFTHYSLTFALPSTAGKTIGANNDDNTYLNFWYSAGSSFNARSGTVGVQSGTIWLWGVQLEIGSVATPLEKPDPRYDLSNCQRFYQVGQLGLSGYTEAGGNIYFSNNYPVLMRSAPTVTTLGNFSSNTGPLSWIPNDPTNSGMVLAAAGTATGGFVLNATYTASADL